jgi:hypothetical protein
MDDMQDAEVVMTEVDELDTGRLRHLSRLAD